MFWSYTAQFVHFKSPWLQWEQMPTFLIGEYFFYFMTLVALVHAIRNGSRYLLVWWAALFAGTANDVFFMFLPVVDNFWQAQATIMITPRLPLYIPCMYICFLYYSQVAAWRLPSLTIATAALTGLLAFLFYAPYDIVGAKFLWWTWHLTDAPIQARWLGVPIGSSMWVTTFGASFSLILQIATHKYPTIGIKKFLTSILIISLLTTPLMLVQMTLLQLVDKQRLPSVTTLICLFSIYIFVILIGMFVHRKKSYRFQFNLDEHSAWLNLTIISYYLMLLAIIMFGKPENQISEGVHQTVGPCHVQGTDISGHVRNLFICKDNVITEFDINCMGGTPKEYSNWYTICGKPYTDFSRWLLGMLLINTLGVVTYTTLYTNRKTKYVPQRDIKRVIA